MIQPLSYTLLEEMVVQFEFQGIYWEFIVVHYTEPPNAETCSTLTKSLVKKSLVESSCIYVHCSFTLLLLVHDVTN